MSASSPSRRDESARQTQGKRRSFWSPVSDALLEHFPLFLAVAAYLASAIVLTTVVPVQSFTPSLRIPGGPDAHLFLVTTCVFFLLADTLARRRNRLPMPGPLAGATVNAVAGQLVGLVLCLVLTVLLLNTYATWKSAIPTLGPYRWDSALETLDRKLHGGRDPWTLLQPLLRRPGWTAALDYCYGLWFPACTAALAWQACSSRRLLRAQFFLSYALVYIVLGTILALLLASAGPGFYGDVVRGPNPYAPLLGYLSQVDAHTPLLALSGQRALWHLLVTHQSVPFFAISAMPSVHIAVVVLVALVGWRSHRALGVLLTLYAFVVLLGSVALGWHYALDGYVSIAGTLAIWSGSGRLARHYFAATGLPTET